MMSPPFPEASRLGFGCASVGSRVGRSDSLRALATAHDLGVNWFDVAPSYGDGLAEEILGTFARGRRQSVHICTKVGIVAPSIGPAQRLLRPMVRSVVRRAPAIRSLVARGRAEPQRLVLDRAAILASLERSLRRLGTDYVDVLALHDPLLEDVQSEVLGEVLAEVVTSGKARAAGVAGSIEAAARAIEGHRPFRHVQFAHGPGLPGLAGFAAEFPDGRRDVHLVTHSVYSTALVRRALASRGAARQHFAQRLAAHGYGGLDFEMAVRAAALDTCLSANATGTVLVSMLGSGHAAFAARRLGDHRGRDASAVFAALAELEPARLS